MLRKKITTLAVSLGLVMATSTVLNAGENNGIGFGVTLKGAVVDTTGSETLRTTGQVTSAEERAAIAIPSFFVQYESPWGVVLGYDFVSESGDTEIGNKSRLLTNPLGSGEGDSGTNKASAEIDSIETIYLESPAYAGIYVSVGYVEADIITTESLDSGGSYGNASVDGYALGIGKRGHFGDSNLFYKLQGTYTDLGSVTLTNDSNTIKADLEAVTAGLSIGYAF
jgi:hypothetical protein